LRKVLDDKNVGDSEAVRRYFFRTKGEDRNSFVSIHTEINLPFKTKDLRWSYEKMHIKGGRKQGKGQYGK
jgi:hypothetical protein